MNEDVTAQPTGLSPALRAQEEKDFAPGSHGCHEALHMASFFAAAVDSNLCDHPAIAQNPAWMDLAQDAADALFKLYQAIGNEHMKEIPDQPRGLSAAEAPSAAGVTPESDTPAEAAP